MNDYDFHREENFNNLWSKVEIVRPVPYSLFTFGASDLEYYLVTDGEEADGLVEVRRGCVRVTRPLIISPHNAPPEFRNFFESEQFGGMIDFLMSRSAAFSNLKLENTQQQPELLSDNIEEVVAKLNRRLDTEEEDRVAILTAPHGLGGAAVFKYTVTRIMDSAPGNIQELRERGFLPE
ncbi:hypothetical protein KOR42_28700 [Thalassoglobus neptunius]|uniref:Uncharacterized protein n=1 Tax=Thalassoglobus neptunius TaxID=1938619 RepID=A0A5C5WZ83_9PLAN|nr:hypothetical protein [Thalassoglobus neptunius]TWT55243.1 hypothetical protein KOR42_28700 [Thalassoglobus neptunius]